VGTQLLCAHGVQSRRLALIPWLSDAAISGIVWLWILCLIWPSVVKH
jgi:hypothetical protein